MNENVVDVLIYLYENYMDGETPLLTDQGELRQELGEAGFPDREIDKALRWLEELAASQRLPSAKAQGTQSFRIYTDEEQLRLDTDSRGLLIFLEHNGILTQESRELVIERALALDTPRISVEELKWIVLLVLLNQPGQELAFAHMEELVYNELAAYIH